MGSDHSNWLATLGGALLWPLKALVRPWWEKLVEKKAESAAVRAKMLEAIVAFRVADYQRKGRVSDPDRERGLTLRVVELLRPSLLSDARIDLCSPAALTAIEQEIELNAVALTAWVELACLVETGAFDPHHNITVNFKDDRGNQSHGMTFIAGLQDAYPFTHILAMEGFTRGTVSGTAVSLLGKYCARLILPETMFQIAPPVPEPNMLMEVSGDAKRLPRGWTPKGRKP
jgi:hypothetical protein